MSIATTARERMALRVYGALWWLVTPLVALYLWWRGRAQPAYRADWRERFAGRYREAPAKRCVWIHAVSVGETRAVAPLVHALRAAYPDLAFVMTHMTPTGRETAIALFGDDVAHGYLSYDYRFATRRFLAHWRPLIGLVMETEIWPRLLAEAEGAEVPILLVNGRLSARSLASALRWPALMRPAARRFARILAQTAGDAERFAILAARHEGQAPAIDVVGNLKFDLRLPEPQRAIAADFRARIAAHADGHRRAVVLCASTRDGEEAAIFLAWLKAHDGVARDRRPLLAVVPRHPQRFDEVVAAARSMGLVAQRRSVDGPVVDAVDVWIGDSMGEMLAYYLAADVAYVGGSLVPLGGQNLIEAAAAGCPVLIGPHTFNFTDASNEAVAAGAALRVPDYDGMVAAALALVDDDGRRAAMAEAGIRFSEAHRGATERTMAIVHRMLAPHVV